jgi:hypothetical protein
LEQRLSIRPTEERQIIDQERHARGDYRDERNSGNVARRVAYPGQWLLALANPLWSRTIHAVVLGNQTGDRLRHRHSVTMPRVRDMCGMSREQEQDKQEYPGRQPVNNRQVLVEHRPRMRAPHPPSLPPWPDEGNVTDDETAARWPPSVIDRSSADRLGCSRSPWHRRVAGIPGRCL